MGPSDQSEPPFNHSHFLPLIFKPRFVYRQRQIHLFNKTQFGGLTVCFVIVSTNIILVMTTCLIGDHTSTWYRIIWNKLSLPQGAYISSTDETDYFFINAASYKPGLWVFCPEIKQKDRAVKAKTPEALFCWGPIQSIFPDVMCLSSVLFAGRPSYLQGVFIIFYWSLWIFMIESYNFRAKVMSVVEVCRPLSIFQ